MTKKRDNSSPITYRRLDQALTRLGFVRATTPDFTAYREAEHNALIVLPLMGDQEIVGDPHLVAVRNTVTLKGVASKAELDSLLSRSARREDATPDWSTVEASAGAMQVPEIETHIYPSTGPGISRSSGTHRGKKRATPRKKASLTPLAPG